MELSLKVVCAALPIFDLSIYEAFKIEFKTRNFAMTLSNFQWKIFQKSFIFLFDKKFSIWGVDHWGT